jgi:4-hydroxybenzoate polyprenyltransferase
VTVPARRSTARAAVAVLRIPHWVKNGFVLAPLFFSKLLDDSDAVGTAIAATAIFALISSSIYVLNDWVDREEDAKHPLKKDRPLARGELTGRQAAIVGVTVLVLGAALTAATGMPWKFVGVLGGYLVMNVLYSTLLRTAALVDVCVIAAGFVLRVLAGTTALDVPASSWIVLSSGLLALLLGLGKRRTDLAQEGEARRRSLEGYTVEFIDTALATFAAAVIGFYALFTVSDYALQRFGNEHLYLTTFWVAVGVLRYLQLIIVKGSYGSPTDIALRDRPMQLIVAGWLITFYVLAYPLGNG